MGTRLHDVAMEGQISKEEEEARLKLAGRRQLHLRLINAGLLEPHELGPGVVVLFEGWDAAGKGGAIRRLSSALDPRHLSVASFAAPSEREGRHHFLWRFWPHLPGSGGMTVFDRSWYGRVLVERVESLIEPTQWERAYDEINAFERSLVHDGTIIVKFLLHISDEEQLQRFDARQADPLKRWKLTDEDWRNRAKRHEYEIAMDEMIERTSTTEAPWDVIGADAKRTARVNILETLNLRIEQGMRAAGIEVPDSRGDDYNASSV